MGHVAQIVADAFGVTVVDLKGKGRARNITYPRQEAMARIKDLLPHISSSKIGRFFNRDHTTVLHGVAAVRRRGLCDRVDHLLRLQA
jgi:chromosomal replication initiator protein